MVKKKQDSKTQQELNLPPQDHYLHNAFENMLEGFQIIGRDWSYLYINEVAAGHGEKTVAELLGRRMMDVFPGIEKTGLFRTLKTCMMKGSARTLVNEFAYADGHTRWFELRISPVPDGLSILSLDVTERKLAEAKVERLTRTLTLLSNVNQSIVRIRDLDVLLKKVCQIAVEDGGLSLVWIGLLDEVEHKIRIVAKEGNGFAYLDKLDLHAGNPPVKNCPVDAALRTGQHNVCQLANLSSDEAAPCQQTALENGFLSSASFPLYVNSEIRGSINLYSDVPDFFDREKVRLLRDMSMNISFAMEAAEDQEALLQNTRRLENVEIYTHLGSWEYDVRTGRGSWSKGMYRMFGLEERGGVPSVEEYLDVIHPEDRTMLEEVMQQMARGEVPTPREFRTHPQLGPVRYFLPTVATLRDPESGEPIKFIGTQVDITEHKHAENALRQSERSYRALLEQIPAIVYIDDIVDGKDRISFISPQLELIMGAKVEDWMQQGVQVWINHQHPEDREYVNSMYKDFIHKGGVYDCEYRMVRDDGRIVWFHDKAVMIEASENGGMRQAHGVIYDVTKQKQVDAELRQRLKELETLHTISVALRTAQSLDEALPRLLDETLANMETDAGEIMLYDPVSRELYVAVARGWHTQLNPVSIKPGEGVSGQVFLSGKMYYSRELSQDPLVLPSAQERIPAGWGGVCLPIRTGEDVVGVWFVSMRLPRQFSPEQLRLLESLAEMAGAATHRIRLHEETVHRLENLQALHEVDLAITSNFDLRPTLDIVIEHTIHQLKVDAVDILLLRKGLQTLEYAAGQGFRTPINKGASVRIGESFAGRAALERRTLHVDRPNEFHTNQLFSAFWKGEGFVSYYCVPLLAKGEVKGVMEIFNRSPMLNDTEWMYYLETLAGQAAIAIDNTQLFENLQQANLELGVAYEATIEGWSRALDLRDQETEGHTQRVTEMTLDLASDFKFIPTELLSIRRGAILHDIGKISVSDSILRKPEPLTQEETAIMRRHPQVAYEMLKPIHYLHESLDIPYCHHEKWDGTGYPRGLAGENIPLAARIFAVVDVFDALSTSRPYREAWPKQKALDYIREQSGIHFDPQVVEVFLRRYSNDL